MNSTVSVNSPRARSSFLSMAASAALLLLCFALFEGLLQASGQPAPLKYYWLIHSAAAAAALAGSAGVLKRKEWARKLLIGALSFSIPWTLYFTWLSFSAHKTAGLSPAALIAGDLLLCALFSWAIYGLCRPGIRAEFQ